VQARLSGRVIWNGLAMADPRTQAGEDQDWDVSAPTGDKRRMTKTVSYRVLPSEFAALRKAMADREYDTIGAFARAAALGATLAPVMTRRDLRRCVGMLGAMGGTFDKIAARAQTEGMRHIESDLHLVCVNCALP